MQSYDARLMSGTLPLQVDPLRLADEGSHLLGSLTGSSMTRLQESCRLPEGVVHVDLQFERVGQGERRLHGSVRALIEMACRRCLQPLRIEIEARPQFVLLQPGESEPADAETLLVEAPLSLAALVEDELLLSLPMSPAHAEQACTTGLPEVSGRVDPSERKTNPFAELRGFKTNNP